MTTEVEVIASEVEVSIEGEVHVVDVQDNQVEVSVEAAATEAPVPYGTAEDQMLMWDNTLQIWELVAKPDVDLIADGTTDGAMLVWDTATSAWIEITATRINDSGVFVTDGGQFSSEVVDGIGETAFTLNSSNAIVNGSLFKLQNNGVDKFTIDKDGKLDAGGATYHKVGNNVLLGGAAISGYYEYSDSGGYTVKMYPWNGQIIVNPLAGAAGSITYSIGGTPVINFSRAQLMPMYASGTNLGGSGANQAWKDYYTNGNIHVMNATNGMKVGTAATQKIGFWNATPVAQPSGTGETLGFTAGSGTGVNDDSTFTGNIGSTAYRINDIVKALKQIGALAQ